MTDRFPVTIPQTMLLTWESQVQQYPACGMPGLSYFRGDVESGYVDCLLWRDEHGTVLGILNRYPKDFPPWEIRGNVNVFIDPAHKRQGIGTTLVNECITRWGPIDPAQQQYTPEGAAFAARLMDGAHRGGALNRKE